MNLSEITSSNIFMFCCGLLLALFIVLIFRKQLISRRNAMIRFVKSFIKKDSIDERMEEDNE